ncbi:hypothetical protein OPQ81_005209 [Rhizoctonia solani]|nr:hypothetical protein OPQ81_005209 [Rhizoctonia solani]
MSKEHLLRIAFLRMGYMEFTSKPRIRVSRSNNDKAMNNKAESQFWSFIDSKLEKLHQISLKDRLGSLERNLTEDKRIFPGPRATSSAIPSANIPEGQPNVTHAISTRAVCQSATPLVDTWSVDRDVASSRQPSADPSSLICEPEFEQDGGGEAPEPGSALDYAQATSVYMPIDSRYGHGQVSYPQSSLPAGTPTRKRITLARRGASHGMGLRSNAIRHNPLGTPSRLSAPSPILMGSPHRPENTQYCCERKEQI